MENGGLERGLSSLSHRGLHECSRCGEGKREREEGRAGKLFPLIPALSLFFNIKVLLLFWASQLREYTCVWAHQETGTERLKPKEQSPIKIRLYLYLLI